MLDLDENTLRYMWKTSPSKKEGYIRNYSTVTPEGDEIEVDFNFAREMARVSVRLEEENGREYYAVIKSGTILQERDVALRRPVDMSSRLKGVRPYFLFLQDRALLSALGGNFGLPEEPLYPEPGESYRLPETFLQGRKRRNLFQWILDHLKKKREIENQDHRFWKKMLRRVPDELFDISLGALLVGAFFNQFLSITELAGYLGALGIFTGAWDWVWRQRSPFLPKVALMLAISAAAVYIQVQNRLWGILL